MVASATTSPLYRRIRGGGSGGGGVGVEIYELCGDAHTDRERERVGSRLCFFYSSVIKQFNITNTGLDNTSAPMGNGVGVRQPPTTPFVTPGPSPLSPSLYLLERGRMFRFISLFSLSFLIA